MYLWMNGIHFLGPWKTFKVFGLDLGLDLSLSFYCLKNSWV